MSRRNRSSSGRRESVVGIFFPRIEAVFYDLDGTLADTEELLLRLWVEMLAEHGQVFTVEDYLGIIGTPEDEKVPELLARFGIAEDPKAFYARFTERLKDLIGTDLQARPGAETSLDKSRKIGAPLGLVTSATEWHADTALTRLGFKKRFHPSCRITAQTEGLQRRKPFPDPYLLAAKRLHVKPYRCVVFEDSRHGATAARKAGMIVVGVPHRLSPRDQLEGVAHYVLPDGQDIGDFEFTDIEHLLPQ